MLKIFPLLLLFVSPVGTAEESYQRAVDAVGSQKLEDALDHFEAALAADPDNLRYGNDYRQAVIRLKAYDRCIAFFENLVESHPQAANAFLNLGFAYVDKIPDAGSITQVINANSALSYFTKSLEIRPSWIGLYTRGNSYLYWPRIFNRTHLGIADLEEALKIQQSAAKKDLYVRVYIALGDGYLKMDDPEKAREIWKKGLEVFPGNAELTRRMTASSEDQAAILQATYDPNRRVDTNLQEIWQDQ
jgi:tetratricopeptide (TPR) repeat protein